MFRANTRIVCVREKGFSESGQSVKMQIRGGKVFGFSAETASEKPPILRRATGGTTRVRVTKSDVINNTCWFYPLPPPGPSPVRFIIIFSSKSIFLPYRRCRLSTTDFRQRVVRRPRLDSNGAAKRPRRIEFPKNRKINKPQPPMRW